MGSVSGICDPPAASAGSDIVLPGGRENVQGRDVEQQQQPNVQRGEPPQPNINLRVHARPPEEKKVKQPSPAALWEEFKRHIQHIKRDNESLQVYKLHHCVGTVDGAGVLCFCFF